jgi:polysaccharide biosynthesis protein PslG
MDRPGRRLAKLVRVVALGPTDGSLTDQAKGVIVAARRPHPLAALATLALVAAFALVGGASSARAAVAPGFVGITSQDTFIGDETYRQEQFAGMQAAGITLIRQVFDWRTIEPKRGVFDFSPYDQFVADAAEHGIEVMPVFYDEPGFLSSAPKHHVRKLLKDDYPPKHLGSIAALAKAAVDYYGPNGTFWQQNPSVPQVPIRVWQIWDEPNLNFFWYPHANARHYVKLLKAAAKAIHSVDPGAEVVTAGMPQSKDGINLFKFVRELLHAGAGQWMNTLAVNAYSHNANGVIKIIKTVRRLMNAHGASACGIRVSEIGWSDVGPRSRFRAGVKGQSKQITNVIEAFGKDTNTLKLRGFVYYTWRDTLPFKGVKDFWGLHTGLLEQNGTPKPALSAFTSAVAAL